MAKQDPEYRHPYYLANREKYAEQDRRRYAENRDKINARRRAYRAANPEKARTRAREYTRKSVARFAPGGYIHRMPLAEWASRWEAQDGKCYLCRDDLNEASRIAIEHDHRCCGPSASCVTCRRGLACVNCNTAIAMARDDPARLRRIADALEAAQAAVDERMKQRGGQLEMIDLSDMAKNGPWVSSQAGGNMSSSNDQAMTAPGSPPVDPLPDREHQGDPTVTMTSNPRTVMTTGTAYSPTSVTWKDTIIDG